MADWWFGIATIDHFWIQRRFDVLRRLAGSLIPIAGEIAEIGCGHGLLQRQIEETYGREVTGFDLNEFALKQSLARLSNIFCYDIHQQDPSLRQRFDLMFLFDVLEHMADEDLPSSSNVPLGSGRKAGSERSRRQVGVFSL